MATKTATKSDRLFLFYGSDEAKAKEAALKLSRKIAPKDEEFGLEIINGAAENSDHATRILAQTTEAIQTLPFFGGDKLVWLQGANFFGDNIVGKAETTLKAVESFLDLLKGGIPDDVKLIISATEMDKRRAFYKQIDKIAKVEAHDKVDVSKEGWEVKVISWAQKEAQKKGINFGYGALERFVITAGADTRTLSNELEKLSLYFGDREISADEISDMVTATHSGVIFEIGDALSRKDLPRTLHLIEKQLQNGEGAIGILRAAIIPKVRGMLHARDLVSRHNLAAGRNFKAFESQINSLPAAETAHLPRKKDGNISAYPIFLSAQATKKFTVEELVTALQACLEADLRLVTTALDHRLVLCQLVTKVLAQQR
ncbi:MAG: DNA polymerase III subunit delta [Verrucomicrobiales bacterium]|nr:DNA polymerase III subunit delta [Verrucomicrobiales bacterium]